MEQLCHVCVWGMKEWRKGRTRKNSDLVSCTRYEAKRRVLTLPPFFIMELELFKLNLPRLIFASEKIRDLHWSRSFCASGCTIQYNLIQSQNRTLYYSLRIIDQDTR